MKIIGSGHRELQIADPTCVWVSLYINRDENPHQAATRMLTKRCAAIAKKQYPQLAAQLFPKQRDGKICLGWKTLVSFSACPMGSPPVVKWNLTLAAANDIDAPALQQLFFQFALPRVDDTDLQTI